MPKKMFDMRVDKVKSMGFTLTPVWKTVDGKRELNIEGEFTINGKNLLYNPHTGKNSKGFVKALGDEESYRKFMDSVSLTGSPEGLAIVFASYCAFAIPQFIQTLPGTEEVTVKKFFEGLAETAKSMQTLQDGVEELSGGLQGPTADGQAPAEIEGLPEEVEIEGLPEEVEIEGLPEEVEIEGLPEEVVQGPNDTPVAGSLAKQDDSTESLVIE